MLEKAQICLGRIEGRAHESVAKAWLQYASDKDLSQFSFLKQTGLDNETEIENERLFSTLSQFKSLYSYLNKETE